MTRAESGRRSQPRRFAQRTKCRPALERLEDRVTPSAGDLDITFGQDSNGKATYGHPSAANVVSAVAIQPDGKIVMAWTNYFFADNPRAGIARFDPNGKDGDPSFDSLSFQVHGVATDVALHNGKIVVVGFGAGEDDSDFFAMRLNDDGTPDTSFGNSSQDGVALIDFGGFEKCYGVAIQDDGRIVLAGTTTNLDTNRSKFAVARLLPDGTLDNGPGAFAVDGLKTTDFNDLGFHKAEIRDVAIQADGRIVVGGSAFVFGEFGGGAFFTAARYHSDGTLDASFAGDGRMVSEIGAARGLAVQPDGKIILAGHAPQEDFTFDIALERYNTDGSLDSSFGEAGRVESAFAGDSNEAANSVLVMPNGKILVGGWTDYDGDSGDNFALARYDASGALDTTFSNDGLVATDFVLEDDEVLGIALQFGQIVAVGRAGDKMAMARYASKTFIGSFELELSDGVASLLGSDGDDVVKIIDLGGGGYEFIAPDGRERLSVSGIRKVLVQGFGGNDVVDVHGDIKNRIGRPGGEDGRWIDFDGGAGVNKLIVQGGRGTQIVSVTGVAVPDPRLPDPHVSMYDVRTGGQTDVFARNISGISAFLGDGDDVCDVQWDEQFAGVDTLRVDAGAGDDQIAVHAEIASVPPEPGLPPEGPRVTTKPIIGRVVIEIFAGFGNDDVQVDLSTIDVSDVQVDLYGENGNDHLDLITHLAFNPQPDPPDAFLTTTVDGGRGNDVLSHRQTVIPPTPRIPPTPTMSEPGVVVAARPIIGFEITQTILGGDGNDDVLATSEGYIPPDGLANVTVNLGSGRNVADVVFGLNVDGTWNGQVVGGNGADDVAVSLVGAPGAEVGIVPINGHVGLGGHARLNLHLGNGQNNASIFADHLMIDGTFVASTYGGTVADTVGIVVPCVHEGPEGDMSWIAHLGIGNNSYSALFSEATIDGRATFTYQGGSGTDAVAIVPIEGGHVGLGAHVSIRADLGNGQNTGAVEVFDAVIEGQMTIAVTGGVNADDFAATFLGTQLAPQARLSVGANLGNGQNKGLVEIIDSIFEGQASIQILGGAAADDLGVSFSGGRIDAAATLAMQLVGNAGPNTLRADVATLLFGKAQFDLIGGANRDMIAARARLDPRSTGIVSAKLFGFAGNDDLTCDITGDLARIMDSILDGGAGLDTGRAHPRVRILNCER